MKFYPTRPHRQFLYFIFVSILFIFSCSKDSDLLNDAIFNEAAKSIEEREAQKEEEQETEEEAVTEEVVTEEVENEEVVDEQENPSEELILESRTTTFHPFQDAYVQDGNGINRDIIRLQQNKRKSYILYDLSAVDSVGGVITEAHFEFTVNKDPGHGEIKIFKGTFTNWTEEEIDGETAPEPDIELGSIDKVYKIGQTETVPLNATEIIPEKTTLVLTHLQGDDLAIASKEHPTEEGPKLLVTYNTPKDAKAIEEYIIEEEVLAEEVETPIEEETPDEGGEEENPSEDPENEQPNEAPVAKITADETSGEAPLEIDFEGSRSTDDTAVKGYLWDFKDGSTSTEKNPTHIFEEPGTYEVELTVSDEEGLTDTAVVDITVEESTNEAPVAEATADKTKGEAPLEVAFSARKSTDDTAIKSYLWDFKDGSSTTKTKNPTHTFDEAGTYEVELTVFDEKGLTDTAVISITVEEPANKAPVAEATADKTKGEAPLEVAFSARKSTDDTAIKSYLWDFKDGSSTTKTKNPTHTFDKEGTYEVELTVSDEEGLTDTAVITITVEERKNEAPVAIAKANKTKGEAPLEVAFSSKSSSDDKEIVSYSWDFGVYGIVSKKNPTQVFEDPGTYTVVLTVQDAEGLSHSDSIKITVEEPPVPTTPSTSEEVRYWKDKFDSQWNMDRSQAYSLANSRNRNQEYYYLSYYIDGLSSIWQATGDDSYLQTVLDIIETTVDDAKSVGGGYLGWRSSEGSEVALWDSYYWRHVATLLRVIHQSPSVKSRYKSVYNKLLAFSEKHIWERYEDDSVTNFYRSRTHMASHWARIGMELYIITGKSKYKKVFDNISFGTMIGYPSNLRNQLRPNPKNSNAYAWNMKWGNNGGSSIQDTSHGGAIVHFWVQAYENGMYWNKNDINALIKTVDIVWPKSDPVNIRKNVDGTGGTTPGGRLHEWLPLARYDQKLQNRIKKDYNKRHLDYYGSQIMGIAALNAKILSDGRAAYPN